jgi:hypothetical protein
MNSYSAARSRGPGRVPLGVVARDPADRKIAENLAQGAGSLGFEGPVEPGLVVGYRQISLGERLTEADDDLLPLTVADPDAEIGVGRAVWSLR